MSHQIKEEKKVSTYFTYGVGTTETAQKTVKFTVQTLMNKCSKNLDFFNDMHFYVIDDCKTIPKASIFTRVVKCGKNNYSGVTMNPLGNHNKKEIVILTNNTSNFIRKLYNPRLMDTLSPTDTKNTTLHEIGHLFDAYFGEKPSADVINASENWEENVELFEKIVEYLKTSELSDSEEFKQAYTKDIENLLMRSDCDVLREDLNYFSPDYFIQDGKGGIDISDGVTREEIDDAEFERAEVFAESFAYNLGADSIEFNEEIFRTVYKNCINVVKKYISEFLNIKPETMEASMVYTGLKTASDTP